MVSRRTSLRRCLRFLLAAACAFAPMSLMGAPVPVSVGADIDSEPSLLLRRNGEYVLAFTRTDLRGGTVLDRDLFVTRSLDGGQSWSAPDPVLADRNVMEGPAELAELSDGTVLLFATTNATGVDRIFLVSSPDAVAWTPSASPLEFGFGNSVPQRRAHPQVLPGDSLYLIYETSGPDNLYVSRSLSRGLLWDADPTLVAEGAWHGRIQIGSAGAIHAVYQDTASGLALRRTSPGGSFWRDWTAGPVVVMDAGIENRSPQLVPRQDGSWTVFAGVLEASAPAGARIAYRRSPDGLDWGAPVEVMVDGSLDEGNPHAVVPGAGSICIAWDATLASGGVPTEGDIWFDCLADTACTQAPVVTGTVEAADADPCAFSGIGLLWQPVLSWGSGTRGYYEVHRSTDPVFTPDPTTLIGVATGTSYVDTQAAPAVAYTYLVRAVNDEICGPGGTGLYSDIPGTRLADVIQPPPAGPVGDLRLSRDPAVGNVLFEWAPAPGSSTTRLYRSTSPLPGPSWRPFGSPVGGTIYDSPEPAEPLLFYLAAGLNDCGVEGP